MSNEQEYLAVSMQAVAQSGGDKALDALGWWDMLGHLDDPDARLAVYALFRAQGAALGSSAAIGGLLAQPFAKEFEFAPGEVISAITRHSPRRGDVHVVVGDAAGRRLLVDMPGLGGALVDKAELQAIDVPGRLAVAEVEAATATLILPEAAAAPLRAQAVALGRVALAMEMLGAADACVSLAIEYSGQREQFGKPIGSFQAVRHLLAWARTDCVAIETVARSAVAMGTAMPDQFDAALKALAGRNGRKACERALQVFGGIGFTAEHDHHHFHGRVLALDALLGTSAGLTNELGRWMRTERRDPEWAAAIRSV
jgi:hypothetical protein